MTQPTWMLWMTIHEECERHNWWAIDGSIVKTFFSFQKQIPVLWFFLRINTQSKTYSKWAKPTWNNYAVLNKQRVLVTSKLGSYAFTTFASNCSYSHVQVLDIEDVSTQTIEQINEYSIKETRKPSPKFTLKWRNTPSCLICISLQPQNVSPMSFVKKGSDQ